MAGIDLLNQFPNSKMAAAARLGQSQFRSVESTTDVSTSTKSGSATMVAKAGTTSTATLLALCGLTTSFSEIMFTIVSSVTGVAITYGAGTAVVYPQGAQATFNNVSLAQNQITVLTALADTVTVNYVGV